MADWKSVKSISDKYGISVERVIAWVVKAKSPLPLWAAWC